MELGAFRCLRESLTPTEAEAAEEAAPTAAWQAMAAAAAASQAKKVAAASTAAARPAVKPAARVVAPAAPAPVDNGWDDFDEDAKTPTKSSAPTSPTRSAPANEDKAAAMARLKAEDRKSTRLNSSHSGESRMPSSA